MLPPLDDAPPPLPPPPLRVPPLELPPTPIPELPPVLTPLLDAPPLAAPDPPPPGGANVVEPPPDELMSPDGLPAPASGVGLNCVAHPKTPNKQPRLTFRQGQNTEADSTHLRPSSKVGRNPVAPS